VKARRPSFGTLHVASVKFINQLHRARQRRQKPGTYPPENARGPRISDTRQGGGQGRSICLAIRGTLHTNFKIPSWKARKRSLRAMRRGGTTRRDKVTGSGLFAAFAVSGRRSRACCWLVAARGWRIPRAYGFGSEIAAISEPYFGNIAILGHFGLLRPSRTNNISLK
jgi:hypothetical protein